jgi:hypothetical protein
MTVTPTPVTIENVGFGTIFINRKRYTSDLIIYPDGTIQDAWWRKSGHRLTTTDIVSLIDTHPAVIVAGTGMNGRLIPDDALIQGLRQKRIQFIGQPNRKAMHTFNTLACEQGVGACFHLTC